MNRSSYERHERDRQDEQSPSAGSGRCGTRLYIGNLPPNSDKEFVEEVFKKFGRIKDIAIKQTVSRQLYAFLEYFCPRAAEAARASRDGYTCGDPPKQLRVEPPMGNRNTGRNGSRGGRGAVRRGCYALRIVDLPPSGSWQDIKDHMRDAGEVCYSDVHHDGTGIVEFNTYDSAELAFRTYNGSKFKSHEGETSRITLIRDYRKDSYERSRSRSYDAKRNSYGGRRYNERSYSRDYRRNSRSYYDDRYSSERDRRDDYRSRDRTMRSASPAKRSPSYGRSRSPSRSRSPVRRR